MNELSKLDKEIRADRFEAQIRKRREYNRKLREERMRKFLREKGLVEAVVHSSDRLADLEKEELDPVQVARLKASNDARLKLIDKILPTLKQTDLNAEVTGEGGGPMEVEITANMTLAEASAAYLNNLK